VLSKTGAIRVSPLCLGAMNFGDKFAEVMGALDKKQSYEIMDFFYEQGGNFIDTANVYQEGQSEEWVGDWMQDRNNRDQMIISTKFTSPFNKGTNIRVNFVGNTRKSLHVSVETSLKQLKTSYIDILFVHWWDYTVSVEELMPALDALVKAGKVLYLGISDTPAWVVSKANMYARWHGMSQFVIYQGRWAVSERDLERDIIPMCKDEGMALHIFGSLGSGKYKTKEQLEAMEKAGDKGRNVTSGGRFGQKETDLQAVAVLDAISKEIGKSITSIALAWVLHKAPYVFPIVGGRKVEHLRENIEALTIVLSPEHIKKLDEAVPLHLGFPYNMVGRHASENAMVAMTGVHQWVEEPKPIPPVDPKTFEKK